MGWFYAVAVHPFVAPGTLSGLAVTVLAYALAAWAVYQYLLMPWLAPCMAARTTPLSLAVAHLVWAAAFVVWLTATA